jgi:excisionase family DNA binding protein
MNLADEIERHDGALTVQELARILTISEKLLYRLIRQGRLPALRIGTAIRLDPGVTADWVRARLTVKSNR